MRRVNKWYTETWFELSSIRSRKTTVNSLPGKQAIGKKPNLMKHKTKEWVFSFWLLKFEGLSSCFVTWKATISRHMPLEVMQYFKVLMNGMWNKKILTSQYHSWFSRLSFTPFAVSLIPYKFLSEKSPKYLLSIKNSFQEILLFLISILDEGNWLRARFLN